MNWDKHHTDGYLKPKMLKAFIEQVVNISVRWYEKC